MNAVLEKIADLMNEEQFDEADCLMEELIAADAKLTKLQRNRIICDMIYCFTIGKSRATSLEELLTEDFLRYMRKAKKDLALIRMEYAYALLIEQNPAGVNAAKIRFEMATGKKSCKGREQSERALMRIADKCFLAQYT